MFRYALLVVLLILMAAPGADARKKPVTVAFWHSIPIYQQDVFQQLLNEFHREHPAIRIQETFQCGWPKMPAKLALAQAGGNLPEMAHIVFNFLPVLADQGIPKALDDLIAADPGFHPEDFPAVVAELPKRRGRTWAVPFDLLTLVFYYNKDLFRKAGLDPQRPPKNWAEMLRYARKLTRDTDGDGRIDQWGIIWPSHPFNVTPLIWQNGGSLFASDLSRCALNDPPALEAFRFWHRLFADEKVMDPKSGLEEARQAFLMGKIGMGPELSGGIFFAQQNLPWELGIASLPAGKQASAPLSGGGLSILTTAPKKRKACWEFIRWFTNTKNTTRWHIGCGSTPVRTSALQSLELKLFHRRNPNFAIVTDLKSMRPIDRVHNAGEMADAFKKALEEIRYNRVLPEKALAKAVDRINTVLEKERAFLSKE